MADYSQVPPGAQTQPKPFKAHVDEEKLQHFKDLLKLSSVGVATFENTSNERKYGMTREWLTNAKKVWETQFDWRKWEERINSYPNFTTPVEFNGITIDVHFVALFSRKADAIPLIFYHGWPGSFLEFLQLLDIYKQRYSPEDLPFHLIVPSLPGYAYSSGPPVDKDYDTTEAAGCMDKLMQQLGFGSGYLAQGGDVGSFVARYQGAKCSTCKGCHVNMHTVNPPPENSDQLHVDAVEKQATERMKTFVDRGRAYFWEHGTRTATIGLALSASPLALLSWIGEKFLEWTDEDLPLEEILAGVTLYWMTDCYGRCLYPYRQGVAGGPAVPVQKPFGYSLFPRDIVSAPKSWIETQDNLVSYSQHSSGGHFAAMEKPHELIADIEKFVEIAWRSGKP